ncbi:hypothetical protein ACIBKY_04630 [Nonomuraea sp. NPDC050394]|uniref:hypothetical protein n=1 Tax=Nonomuraea sp. NPDC050394 TaxID=3364363 RepID=UPI0037BCA56D
MRKSIELPNERALPLRTMTSALFRLYDGAGRPGTGQIANAINQDDRYPGTISDERVRQLLRGEGGVPQWLRFKAVVYYLADQHTPALDRDDQAVLFKRLYDAVRTSDQMAEFAPMADGPLESLALSSESAQPPASRMQEPTAPARNPAHHPAPAGLDWTCSRTHCAPTEACL